MSFSFLIIIIKSFAEFPCDNFHVEFFAPSIWDMHPIFISWYSLRVLLNASYYWITLCAACREMKLNTYSDIIFLWLYNHCHILKAIAHIKKMKNLAQNLGSQSYIGCLTISYKKLSKLKDQIRKQFLEANIPLIS